MRDRGETAGSCATSCAHGFATLDLSDDEIAKLHLRHMVGGHSGPAQDELLFRFEFPERPGR